MNLEQQHRVKQTDHPEPTFARLTDEFLNSIPAMLADGATLAEIAALHGTTVGSLKTTCSRRGISLRGTRSDFRARWLIRLSDTAASRLKTEASYRGLNPTELIERLLEVIAADTIFAAVLDDEEA